MIAFTRDELAILNAAGNLRVRICRTAADLVSDDERSNMKQYDVYNYYDDIVGQVWGADAADALETAQQEYGDLIYVLPVKVAAKETNQ